MHESNHSTTEFPASSRDVLTELLRRDRFRPMRRPTQLSQGESQRVAVCRALIANPKLLLADEPTANLDPRNAARVLDALDEHAKKQAATLVVMTHDRNVLTRFDETIDVSAFCAPAQPKPAGVGGHA